MRQFKKTERFTPRTTKAEDSYLSEVDRNRMISVEEEVELATRIMEGDIEARNKLVNANLRFVLSVAKMYTSDPTEYADLVAAGNIGLIEAAEKFDHSRGFKFISYAVWHIRKEMIYYLTNDSKTVRIPSNKNSLLREMRKKSIEIEMREGRPGTSSEILDALNEDESGTRYGSITMEVGDMERLILSDIRPTSFDAPLSSEEGSGNLYDVTASGEDIKPEDTDGMIYFLDEIMKNLSDREKTVVRMRHGIDDLIGHRKSFKEIGDFFKVSPETARGSYIKALRKMKNKARKGNVYLENII